MGLIVLTTPKPLTHSFPFWRPTITIHKKFLKVLVVRLCLSIGPSLSSWKDLLLLIRRPVKNICGWRPRSRHSNDDYQKPTRTRQTSLRVTILPVRSGLVSSSFFRKNDGVERRFRTSQTNSLFRSSSKSSTSVTGWRRVTPLCSGAELKRGSLLLCVRRGPCRKVTTHLRDREESVPELSFVPRTKIPRPPVYLVSGVTGVPGDP